jgi:hypothetical protein
MPPSKQGHSTSGNEGGQTSGGLYKRWTFLPGIRMAIFFIRNSHPSPSIAGRICFSSPDFKKILWSILPSISKRAVPTFPATPNWFHSAVKPDLGSLNGFLESGLLQLSFESRHVWNVVWLIQNLAFVLCNEFDTTATIFAAQLSNLDRLTQTTEIVESHHIKSTACHYSHQGGIRRRTGPAKPNYIGMPKSLVAVHRNLLLTR